MDAILKSQAEQLANTLANQVNTLEDLNGLMRTMMKSALEAQHRLAIHEARKKWTMPIVGWKAALNHFAIVLEGRLPTTLTT